MHNKEKLLNILARISSLQNKIKPLKQNEPEEVAELQVDLDDCKKIALYFFKYPDEIENCVSDPIKDIYTNLKGICETIAELETKLETKLEKKSSQKISAVFFKSYPIANNKKTPSLYGSKYNNSHITSLVNILNKAFPITPRYGTSTAAKALLNTYHANSFLTNRSSKDFFETFMTALKEQFLNGVPMLRSDDEHLIKLTLPYILTCFINTNLSNDEPEVFLKKLKISVETERAKTNFDTTGILSAFEKTQSITFQYRKIIMNLSNSTRANMKLSLS